MTVAHLPTPDLPHFETVPEDLSEATRQVKPALRAQIEASGRSVEEVFAAVEWRVAARIDDFAPEHYERDWVGRFTPEDLDVNGRRGLGMA